MSMQLAELQRAFQDHVLHDDRFVYETISGSAEFPVAVRMRVYADAYHLRLTDALAHNFPRLQQLLGTEAFAMLARGYLKERPSGNVSVRWFGDRLAEHIEQEVHYREQPWLAELARWEWTIAAAFDAADAQPLPLEALGQFEVDDWPQLRFQFHPSVHTLQLRTNAVVICQTLSDGVEMPAPALLDAPQSWVIWRQELATRYRLLEENEAQALETLTGSEPCRPGTFETMCETLCRFHDAEEVPLIAAGLLKAWLTEGLIVAAVKGAWSS